MKRRLGRGRPAWLSSSRLTVAGTSMSLYGSLLITNGLGFAFWWLAAHELPAGEVGDGSAVVSAMQLVALLCVVGLNTLVISELGINPSRSASVVMTAGLVSVSFGLIGGIAVAIVLRATSNTFGLVFANVGWVALFGVGVSVTTLTLVLDGASVGLLRGRLQLARNSVFATVKLALVPAAARLLPVASGMQLVAIWIVGTVSSVFVVLDLVHNREGRARGRRIDFSLVRSHRGLALRHHWLNVAILAPRLALPVVAALIVGPRLTAAFYSALLLVTFVISVPGVLTTVLFALKPGDDAAMRHQVRFTMGISAIVAAVTGPLFFLGSRFALSLFSPHYVVASTSLWILGLITAPSAVKAHYVAVARVANRLGEAALLATVGALGEVALATFGGVLGGISGMALGWLVALCAEAVIFGPTVLRALRFGAVVRVSTADGGEISGGPIA